MGFALWIEDGVAWCAGAHEYRPMGVAIVSATAVFTARDFDPLRRAPSRRAENFHGLFASLPAVNEYLRKRRSRVEKKNLSIQKARVLAIT